MSINGDWQTAANNFEREVLPVLKERGPEIGLMFNSGDEDAKAVVKAYHMIRRSFDPVNDIIIRNALKKMGMLS